MGSQCCSQADHLLCASNDTVLLENSASLEYKKRTTRTVRRDDPLNQHVVITENHASEEKTMLRRGNTSKVSPISEIAVKVIVNAHCYTKEDNKKATLFVKNLRETIATDIAKSGSRRIIRNDSAAFASISTLKHPTTRKQTVNLSVDPSKFRLEQKCLIEDKYEMLYLMGKGAYGEVKKIRDKETNALRAVKIVNKDKCNVSENFMEEIDILKRLVTLFRIYNKMLT